MKFRGRARTFRRSLYFKIFILFLVIFVCTDGNSTDIQKISSEKDNVCFEKRMRFSLEVSLGLFCSYYLSVNLTLPTISFSQVLLLKYSYCCSNLDFGKTPLFTKQSLFYWY